MKILSLKLIQFVPLVEECGIITIHMTLLMVFVSYARRDLFNPATLYPACHAPCGLMLQLLAQVRVSLVTTALSRTRDFHRASLFLALILGCVSLRPTHTMDGYGVMLGLIRA
jgi:hypothetical protein